MFYVSDHATQQVKKNVLVKTYLMKSKSSEAFTPTLKAGYKIPLAFQNKLCMVIYSRYVNNCMRLTEKEGAYKLVTL